MAEQKLTLNKRIQCVRLFSITNNISEVRRRIAAEFGPPTPTRKTVARINTLFDVTGSVKDCKRPGRPISVRTEENKERVAEELERSPDKSKSQRRLSAVLGINRSTLRHILTDMKLRPYHPRLIHALTEDDPDRRVEFSEQWLGKLQEDPDLCKHVVWTDEAKFHVSGSVNRHNCVYWRPTNPYVTVEHNHQSPGIMVWGGVTHSGLIGPFFFEGNVTGASYLELLENEVIPVLENREDFDILWWQQDGAPPHYALAVRERLNEWFPERWIGRRGHLEWPPRSPDLTPPDFFLWGYLKDKVYSHSIQNVDHLRDVILHEFNNIPLEMCRKACENVELRLQACIDLEGGQVDHLMENRNAF